LAQYRFVMDGHLLTAQHSEVKN